MTNREIDEVDDNIVRDLFLFFELVCKRCPSTWEPANPTEGLSTDREVWVEQFSQKFAVVAQNLGWGSVEGNALCPDCLAKRRAT